MSFQLGQSDLDLLCIKKHLKSTLYLLDGTDLDTILNIPTQGPCIDAFLEFL